MPKTASKSSKKPKPNQVTIYPFKGSKPFVTITCSNKGGVGKSAITKLLSTGLAKFDVNVAVFDLEEPEYPLSRFFDLRQITADKTGDSLMEGLLYRKIPRNISVKNLKAMVEGLVDVQYVFIDTPAYNVLDSLDLLSVADLILCPGRPSEECIDKFEVFLPALRLAFPDKAIRAVWNEVFLSENMHTSLIKTTAGQEFFGCHVLSTYLTHRAAQTAAGAHGLTLLEFQNPSDPGYQNFMNFMSEFCSMSRELALKNKQEVAHG